MEKTDDKKTKIFTSVCVCEKENKTARKNTDS